MDDAFVQGFQLDVTNLGDRSREVSFEHDPALGTRKKVVKFWTRQEFLASNVYLVKANSGEVRVVKQLQFKHGHLKNCLSELHVMGRVSKDIGLFVKFFGWFPLKDHVCFVMEHCPFGDISQCFQRPMSEVFVWCMCSQLLEGLAKLHEMNITHRDIKPQNVLVMQKDPLWVKIGDFGVSKSAESSLRTRAGTEGYMAPEVIGLLDDIKEDSSYTNAVDVWSLGCLLYYTLTKRVPFPTYGSLRDYCWEFAPFPDALLAERGVSQSGKRFIADLMALQPQNRPKVSIELMSNWTISSTSSSTTDGEVNPTASTDLTQSTSFRETGQSSNIPERISDTTQTEPFSGDPIWHGYGQDNIALQPITPTPDDDDMDYHSSQLWHTIKEANQKATAQRIRPLLESGANPNKLLNGYTALHLAAKHCLAETVQLLLDYGADITVRTRPDQETALHVTTYIRDLERLKLLLAMFKQNPAVINAQNIDGDTALHLAIARFTSTEAIRLLLEAGASTEIKGRRGRTPLSYAISLCQEEKANMLMDLGHASPDVADDDGRSPLHIAIVSERFGTLHFITKLVELGANVNQMDKEKRTPLYEAAKCNKQDIMCFLLDHGADNKLGSAQLERRLQWAQFWRRLYQGNFWRSGSG